MDWKNSLDKFLTSPPDDGFDGYAEDVVNKFSESFYEQNEDWINNSAGLCTDWMNKLFYKGHSPEISAKIIERAFSGYLKK